MNYTFQIMFFLFHTVDLWSVCSCLAFIVSKIWYRTIRKSIYSKTFIHIRTKSMLYILFYFFIHVKMRSRILWRYLSNTLPSENKTSGEWVGLNELIRSTGFFILFFLLKTLSETFMTFCHAIPALAQGFNGSSTFSLNLHLKQVVQTFT